jgi:hypothetical protein
MIGTGTGHGDDLLALISRDPAGTLAPAARAQAVHPTLVEVVDHPAHPRRISGHISAICGAVIFTFDARSTAAR